MSPSEERKPPSSHRDTCRCLRCFLQRHSSRWMFPLVGFLALIWFCIRVIPKPSRARYPCQRLAFPLASGFVIWVLGAFGSLAVLRKARRRFAQSRYLLAGLLVAVAVAAMSLTITITDSPGVMADVTANDPIGTAGGLYPGRVVWVRDPAATDWAGPGSGTRPYDAVEQSVVDTMLEKAMLAYTGEDTLADAWDAVIRHFNQQQGKGDVGYTAGEKIFIKTNFTLTFDGDRTKANPGWWGYSVDRVDCTDNSPQVTIALLNQLINEVGVTPSDITIGDPSRVVPDYWYDMVHGASGLGNVQILDNATSSANGRTYRQAQYSSTRFYWSDPDTNHFTDVTNDDYVPVSFDEAAYFINFPVLTSHSDAGVTICGKNHYGSLLRSPTDSGYYDMHLTRALEISTDGNYRCMVDLMGHEKVGGNTLLCVTDGLFGAVSWWHGPVKWDMSPFDTDWTSSVMVSQDQVAMDSVCFDFLYNEYDTSGSFPYDYPHMGGTDDYMHEAAQADSPVSGAVYDPEADSVVMDSLGTHEHWDNATYKRYTRNLGTGDGVELVGLMLESDGKPTNPSPSDGATDIGTGHDLGWSAATDEESYDVYVGTSLSAVTYADTSDPEYQGNTASTSYEPGTLSTSTTYYWRVDGVKGTQIWPGDVWSFTTHSGTPDTIIGETGSAPTIDGAVDDQWTAVEPRDMTNVLFGTFSGDADLSGTWKALWDTTNLYFLVEVNDDDKCNDSATTWEDDAVEIMLDGDFSHGSSYDGEDDYELVFGYGDSSVTLGVNSATDTTGLSFAFADTTDGYTFECAMPWAAMGETASAGKLIGLDVHLVDDDDGGSREGKKAWMATTDDSWQYPYLFGVGELRENSAPTAPTTPSPADTATGQSVDVDLGWDACTDPDGDTVSYDVYIGAGSLPGTPTDTGLATNAYDPGTLAGHTTYHWQIVSTDGMGGRTVGSEWTFTTENRSPTTPSNPSPADTATDQALDVNLGWDACTDADGDPVTYDVYFGAGSLPGTPTDTGLATNAYDPGTLAGHTTYHWQIVAKDGYGGQTAGAEWTFTTLNQNPAAPSNPSPADTATDQALDVNLGWDACTDPDGDTVTYDVYFGAGSLPGTPTDTGLATNAYDPGTLSGHTTYHWQIVARDDQGGSTTGAEWTFTTLNQAPTTPRNPSPADTATDQALDVNLGWDACTDADGDTVTYDVYFGAGSLPGTPTDTGLATNSYDPGTLSGHTTYHWQIVARDGYGGETAGGEWTFTTLNQSPTTPSNPTPADTATDQSLDVDLGWDACTDPDGDTVTYDVYFGAGSLPGTPTDTGLATNSYDPGTLAGHTTYHWQIVARDDQGGSTTGAEWTFTTLNQNPTTPSNPSPADTATDQALDVNLGWDACTDPDGDTVTYDVYFGAGSLPGTPTDTGLMTNAYDPGTLSAHTTYHWQIVARDGYGGETAGAEWTFTTLNNAPTAPSNPSPADAATDQALDVNLGWDACTDPDGDTVTYDVYFGAGSLPGTPTDTGLATNSYDPGTLSGHTTYHWQIVAKDGYGGQTAGAEWTFTTLNSAPTAPSNPSPADTATDQSLDVDLGWDACTDADGDTVTYDVYFGAGSLPGTPADTGLATNSYDPGTLSGHTTYHWQIVARDGYGGQTAGAEWTFTTLNNAPTVPSNPTPADGATDQNVDVDVSWDACTDPDGDPVTYDIYFGKDSLPGTPTDTGLMTNTYDPGTLEEHAVYHWQIVARDDQGGATTGAEWTFTTVNNPPSAPSNPSPADGATGQTLDVDLGWDASTDPDGDTVTYDVYFGAGSLPGTPTDTGLATNAYDPGTLSAHTTYHWQIVARDGYGGQTAGAEWMFTTLNNAPTVPSNPTPADAATDQALDVNLGWDACTDPDGDTVTYDVYFGAGSLPGTPSDTGLATNAYDPGTLSGHTTYHWQIVARDGYGGQTVGAEWTFTTLNNAPTTPSSPVPADGATGQALDVDLGWDASTDPDGDTVTYDVYFGAGSLPGTPTDTGLATNAYDPGTLSAHTTYHWQIVAKDGYGGQTAGAEWTFTTLNSAPTAPSNPSPADTATDQALDVNLGWDASTDPDGDTVTYDVYFGAGSLPGTPTDTGLMTNAYDPGTLSGHTTYHWQIVSKDGYGGQTTGAEWTFTTLNNAPTAPSNPSPADTATDQALDVNLGWDACTDPDGDTVTYDVYFGAGSLPGTPTDTGLMTNAYAPGTLSAHTTYHWQIVARDGYGGQTAGAEWTFTTLNSAPTAPSNPSPADAATDQALDVNLGWDACTDADGDTVTYDVYFGAGSLPGTPTDTGLATNAYDPGTLSAHTTYHWQIVARDGYGGETAGAEWTFTTLNNAPTAPSNPTPADGATNQDVNVDLDWDDCTDADGDPVTYDVYFGKDSLPATPSDTGLMASTYDPGTLVEHSNYYWQIVARDDQGGSTTGPQWTFATLNNAPTAPSNPVPADGATGQTLDVDLAWDACTDPDGDTVTYDVYFGAGSLPGTPSDTGLATNAYDPGTLSAHTTYHWQIVAKDAYGGETAGAEWTFTTLNQAPAAPNIPSPADAATGQALDVDLGWSCSDPDGDTLTYDIYFGAGSLPGTPTDTGLATNAYDPGVLSGHTTYHWQVVARDGFGGQTAGPEWTFTTLNQSPSAPSNPTPADAATDQTLNVDVSWDACTDPDGDTVTYDIYFGAGSVPGTATATDLASPTYDPGALAGHTTYHWQVVAKDAYGGQTTGPEWTFTTLNQDPTTPSNPTPSDGATDQLVDVDLGWDACTDPDGDPVTYDIYFGKDSLPASPTDTELMTNSYDPGTLDGHSTYHWQVVARDDQGGLSTGAEWTFTTENRNPDTPANPTPADGATDQALDVDLGWDACTDPDGDPVTYDVYFGAGSLPGTPTDTGLATNAYDPGALSGHTTYHWQIVAKDDQGGSSTGAEWTFTTLNQNPTTPSNPTPADGATDQSVDVDVSWDACTDPDGDPVTYDIYFGKDALPGTPTDTGLMTNTYDPGTLEEHATYHWQIVARDDQGGSTAGAEWTFTTLNNAPTAPSNPTPADGATDQVLGVDLSWDACTDPDGDTVTYDVYLGAGSLPGSPTTTDLASPTYDPGLLNAHTTYHWQVVAKDGYGGQTTGAEWTFTTLNNPPTTPSNPTPADAATDQALDVDLAWDACTDPDGDTVTYDVYFGAGSLPGTATATDLASPAYDPGALDGHTTYHWQVVAKDAYGGQATGPEWTFTTLNQDPSAPANPTPADGAPGQGLDVDLSWDACTDPEGDTVTYDVYFGKDSLPGTATATDLASPTYDPGSLDVDSTYKWQVVAKDGYGGSTTGPEWTFNTTSNNAPTANDDAYSVLIGEVLNVAAPGVLSNDSDLESDPLTAVQDSDVSNGTLTFNADGSFTYTPNGGFTGTDTFTYHANDGTSNSNVATVTITVVSEMAVEAGTVTGVGGTWTTVTLQHNYVSPVVVCSRHYNNYLEPAVVRVRNASGNQFEVKLQDPDGDPPTAEDVHYLVVETGVWQLPDGTNIEARRVDCDVTAHDADWSTAVRETYTYQQSYTNPVVLGQVMTHNDADWSVFWSSAASAQDPPSASTCFVGKHVGQDPDTTRATETLGVVVIEQATGELEGVPYEAALGDDTVQGIDNAPPYIYALSNFTQTPEVGIISMAAMDGTDGGWAVLYGATKLTTTAIKLAIDEDTLVDTERSHSTEQVGYLVFESAVDYTGSPNRVPIAQDDSYSVDEDNTLNVAAPGVLGNDSDPDGDAMTAVLQSGVSDGSLSLSSDGSFTYTPDANFNGTDSFTYVADDGTGQSDPATVTITVNSVPDDPVAGDDAYTCLEDQTLSVSAPGVLVNDTDGDGDSLTAVLDADVSNGSLTLNADGSFTYTPNTGWTGDDTFTYHANDGSADSNVATVTITVNPLPLEVGVEGGVVQNVGGAWMTVNLQNSYSSPIVVCVPNYKRNIIPIIARVRNVGTASFQLKLANPSGAAVSAEDVHYLVVEEGVWQLPDGRNIEAARVSSSQTNSAGAWSTSLMQAYAYQQSYTNPVVLGQVMTANDADWSVFWTCAADRGTPPDASTCYVGKHVAEDPDDTRATETLGVIVVEQGSGTLDGVPYETALGADTVKGVSDLPPYEYALSNFSTTPEVGVVTMAAMDGWNGGWGLLYGSEPLVYDGLRLAVDEDQVKDSERAHTTEQLGYMVFEQAFAYSGVANRLPEAQDDAYSVAEDTVLSVAAPGVLDNDSDGDGDPITAVLNSGVSDGSLTLNADGSFDYTPDADFSGTDSFTYVADDGTGQSDPATVTITVTAVNDAPSAQDDSYSTPADETLVMGAPGVLGNDSDPDGDALSAAVDTPVAHGTLNFSSDGSFTYTPDAGWTGTDQFYYHANDGTADSGPAAVSIDVYDLADQVTMEVGTVGSVGGTWKTVSLQGSYISPVVVCTAGYDNNAASVVPRVRNAGSGSFEVKLQVPSGGSVNAETIHYMVVEQGAWQVDGVSIEADRVESDGVNGAGGWQLSKMEQYSYQQSYTNPVVLGQVMTANDADWSAFWCCGSGREAPPDSSTCYVGKHAGEDPDTTRAVETLGVIVIEQGSGQLAGEPYEAALGDDSVRGVSNWPPFTYALSAFSSAPEVGIAVQAAMDGPDGAWAVLYGGSPLSATSMDLAVLEDEIADPERGHTYEQVGYAVFGASFVHTDLPTAVDDYYHADADTTLSVAAPGVLDNDSDPNGDPLTAALVDDVTDGTLTLNADGSFDYTPDSGFTGYDSFTYVANDGTGDSAPATVTLEVSPRSASLALETGTVQFVGANWTTVGLSQTYVNPVVVCANGYERNVIPVVTRVRNVGSSSFQVRIQNPAGAAVSAESVHYMVVEAGVWQLPDGCNIEAATVLSDGTNGAGAWDTAQMEQYSYQQSYTVPVVLGQVMTYNDANWSTFWSCDGRVKYAPSASGCYVGKQVGEDSVTTRATETLGVVVIEQGSGTLEGAPYEAALGARSVGGVGDTPPYSYGLSAFSSDPAAAVVTMAGMNGANGGWAVLYGTDPITQTALDLAIDEDQLDDSERSHVNENVAYMVFGSQVIHTSGMGATSVESGSGTLDTASDGQDLLQSSGTESTSGGELTTTSDDGSGAEDLSPPTVEITSVSESAEPAVLRVEGTAQDASAVDAIWVNGVLATATSTGYATWQAGVPVSEGWTADDPAAGVELTVCALDAAGNYAPEADTETVLSVGRCGLVRVSGRSARVKAVAADADADTFQLEALGGTALDLSLTAERPCTVQLRDPWGETALEETGEAVTLAETLAAGGLWTVRVLPGGAAGAYTMELSGTLPDGDASVAGTLSSGQDADDYAVDALRGSLLQVEVRSAEFQPDLQVLDPCGNALALDGAKSMEAGRVVLSGYVLPDSGEPYESGAYTVRVISAGGSGGAYEVVYATRAPAAEELKIQDARLLGTSPSDTVQAGAQLQLKVVGAGEDASDSVVILGGRELAPEGASLTTGSGSLYVTVPADLSGEQAISFRSGGEQSNVLTIQVAP